jgi:hypothetical protein
MTNSEIATTKEKTGEEILRCLKTLVFAKKRLEIELMSPMQPKDYFNQEEEVALCDRGVKMLLKISKKVQNNNV